MPSSAEEFASRQSKFHQSGISQLLGCPRSYALEYVAEMPTPEKPNAAAGTAFHFAAEVHERARLEGKPPVTRDEMFDLAAPELSRMEPNFVPEQLAALTVGTGKNQLAGMAALTARARASIDAFWDGAIDDEGGTIRDLLATWEPVALEVYLSGAVVEGCRELGGTLDGVYRDEAGTVRLADYKTAKSLSYWNEVGEHSQQATHYAALMVLHGAELLGEQLEELPPFEFLVLRSEPSGRKGTTVARRLTYQPMQLDVVGLGDRVRGAEWTVRDGRFLPRPEYQWCRASSCSFYERCQITGELAGTWPVK